MEILSGPSALEGLDFFIASLVSSEEKVLKSFCLFFFKFLVTFRAVFVLSCLVTEENCLLKASAILLGLDRYLPLNLMAWFMLLFGPPLRYLISLKSLVGSDFLLISDTVDLHFSRLCKFFSSSISLLSCRRRGDCGSFFRSSSLCLIFSAVAVGNSG